MATLIRAEISEKNKYYISKERYYELKHFCLQYPEWKKAYIVLNESMLPKAWKADHIRNTMPADVTQELAIRMAYLTDNMEKVEQCAVEADKDLAPYILKSVTEGYSYTYLSSVMEMPASKNMFYDRYRKFFWHLSKVR